MCLCWRSSPAEPQAVPAPFTGALGMAESCEPGCPALPLPAPPSSRSSAGGGGGHDDTLIPQPGMAVFFLPLWRISVFPEPHYSKLYSFVNPPSVLGKSGELGEMRKGTALFLQGSCCSHTALNKFPGELGLGTVHIQTKPVPAVSTSGSPGVPSAPLDTLSLRAQPFRPILSSCPLQAPLCLLDLF